MIVDPWGEVLARAPDEECFVAADLDFARQDEVRDKLPSLANRVAGAYRWPGGGAPPDGPARAGAVDKRRLILDAAIRVFARAGLPRLPRLRRRRRGGRRLRPRLPLLRVQGGDPQHALPRALADHARRDRRDRRHAGGPGARQALHGRRLHHRLLPPRPRPDEGDHRRGHARGELVRARCTSTRSARPTTGSRRSSRARAQDGSFKPDIRVAVRRDVLLRRDRAAALGLDLRPPAGDRRGVRAREGAGGRGDLRRARDPAAARAPSLVKFPRRWATT